MSIETDDLDEEEFDELSYYSDTEDNVEERYVVACQIISNMTIDANPKEDCTSELVDLSICKLLRDEVIVIESSSKYFH